MANAECTSMTLLLSLVAALGIQIVQEWHCNSYCAMIQVPTFGNSTAVLLYTTRKLSSTLDSMFKTPRNHRFMFRLLQCQPLYEFRLCEKWEKIA